MGVPSMQLLAAKTSVTSFAPTDVTGLVGWWDASNAGSFTYSSGVLVSQWNDLSGAGNHIAQADTGKQPSRNGTQNGLDTVVWNGTDECLTKASIALANSAISVFAVFQSAAGGDRAFMETSANYNSNARSFLIYKTSTDTLTSSMKTSGYMTWFTAAIGTAAMTYQTRLSLTTSTGLNANVNGSTSGSANSTATTTAAATSYTLNVGSRNNGASLPWSGEMMEFGIIDGMVSDADRTSLETYMNDKWAVY